MYLLDTNVVSELRKVRMGKADKSVAAWAGAVNAATLYISAITVLELEMGVLRVRAQRIKQGKLLRAWLDGQVLPQVQGFILAIDAAVALRGAPARARSQSRTRCAHCGDGLEFTA